MTRKEALAATNAAYLAATNAANSAAIVTIANAYNTYAAEVARINKEYSQ